MNKCFYIYYIAIAKLLSKRQVGYGLWSVRGHLFRFYIQFNILTL